MATTRSGNDGSGKLMKIVGIITATGVVLLLSGLGLASRWGGTGEKVQNLETRAVQQVGVDQRQDSQISGVVGQVSGLKERVTRTETNQATILSDLEKKDRKLDQLGQKMDRLIELQLP